MPCFNGDKYQPTGPRAYTGTGYARTVVARRDILEKSRFNNEFYVRRIEVDNSGRVTVPGFTVVGSFPVKCKSALTEG